MSLNHRTFRALTRRRGTRLKLRWAQWVEDNGSWRVRFTGTTDFLDGKDYECEDSDGRIHAP